MKGFDLIPAGRGRGGGGRGGGGGLGGIRGEDDHTGGALRPQALFSTPVNIGQKILSHKM